MTDQPAGSRQGETTGAAHGGEVLGNPPVLPRLIRFISKLISIAVRPRGLVVTRRQEVDRPARFFSDGPHRGETRPTRPDPIRAGRSRYRRWAEARCLVTGASWGLGRAIAEHLVRAGARVVLTGRSTERLRAVAGHLIGDGADPGRIITIPADLTAEGDRGRLFADVAGRFAALDLVINNAGIGAAGPFHTHDPDVLRRVFEINVFAMAELCRAALPLLTTGIRRCWSTSVRSIVPGDRAEFPAPER